jgi:Putative transposase
MGGCAKRPFAGPAQVLAYLARYTHRVAITNTRLVELGTDYVSFRWKVSVTFEAVISGWSGPSGADSPKASVPPMGLIG